MDASKIRKMFSIFESDKKGERLVYLDSGATSQRPKFVVDAITRFYSYENASVHRGVYDLSEQATARYEDARAKVAKFINAADSSEIVFTAGTTDGINFIASTWGFDHIKRGDEIVVTQAEHHANLLPWQRLAQKTGAVLRFIEIDTKEFMCKDSALDVISSKTKLVAIIHTSNVLGHIWKKGQLEAVIAKAHSVGARVLLDGAQSVSHQKVDVKKLNPDFFVFSGHKMLAPTGVGVLYIKKELHDEVEPYRVGGSMVYEAWFDRAVWAEAPAKFEAGTPPIAQVLGLSAAIDFFDEHVDFSALGKHEAALCKRAVEGLSSMDGVRVWGNEKVIEKSGHLVSFSVDGVHAHDVAAMLGMRGVAVRAGHHCVQPLAKLLGIEASVRASFYMYNEKEDVDIFIRELREIIKMFKEL